MNFKSLFSVVCAALFMSGCTLTSTHPDQTTIYIQPFYPFGQKDAENIAVNVRDFYKAKVIVLSSKKIFPEARSKSGRYSAPMLGIAAS